MPETPKIDIRPDHWLMVRDILQKHVPDYEVWAFGSRAKWTAKEYSDLDLAVITDQPLPLAVSAALSDDFSESDLPWRVDVVDWARTSESFRPIIERDKVVVLIPPPNYQKKIARILGSIDDKIELNRRINQTLEQMAQAIFKSWFVDFDPVKAKIAAKQAGRDPLRAAMCAISGKTDDELDALRNQENADRVNPKQSGRRNPTIEADDPIAADMLGYGYRLTQPTPDSFSAYDQLAALAELFPDEMEESELGAVPKGWRVCPMPDCIEVNPTRPLKKGTFGPYLDMANVPTNSARAENVILREFTSGSKFVNGDTLLARITPCLENGKTAYVDFLDEGQTGWGSTEFIVLRSKPHWPLEFCYFLCRHPEFRSFAIAQMAGASGRQRVPNDCFSNYRLVEPSKAVAAAFGSQTLELMKEIKTLDAGSRTLTVLRDTLLPKLLSGETPISATESDSATTGS